MKPATRRTGLVVRELADEVIVYDLDRHQAHCLNRTAATIFRGANGSRSFDDLGLLLGRGFPQAERDAVVRLALDQLCAAKILDLDASTPPPAQGPSRRHVLRQAGLGAALLLPAVVSMLAPTPAEAAATCVTDCSGQLFGTGCNCSTNPTAQPCENVCDGSGFCGGPGFCP